MKNNKLLIFSLFFINLYNWIIYVEGKYSIPWIVKYALSILSLGILIFYRFKNPSKPVSGISFYFIIMIFVLWSIFLLTNAILGIDSIFFVQRILGDPYLFIPYLLPLFLLFTKFNLDFFSDLFYYSFLFIVPGIIIQLLVILSGLSPENWSGQSNLIKIFDICGAFLLLTAHISRKKYISYYVLCYYLLWILLWSFYGRRGALIQNMLLLIFMVIIRLRSSLVKAFDRFKIYLSGLLILVLFLAFGYLFTSSYAFQRGFSRDAFIESRGTVFQGFFYDFGSRKPDWIFGRGIDGTILRSFSEYNESSTIENGFLTMLLRGGLVYSIPYLLILLRASYLGFFRSKNDLVKALASFILIQVIMMFSFGLPDFSSRYIFIWISVSVCFTPVMRNRSNDEISQAINNSYS